MKTGRLIIAIISGIILIVALFFIDYQNIISRQNLGWALLIVSSALNIIAMIASNNEKERQG